MANLVSDKYLNVQYNVQTHITASSARTHFTPVAKMLVAVLLHSGR